MTGARGGETFANPRRTRAHSASMAAEAATNLGNSYADDLALERSSDQRYAWLDGQVYAMTGGTLAVDRVYQGVVLTAGSRHA